MVDDKGNCKGFGFVCFALPDDATKAVTEMHLKVINGKPLYVGLAEKREDREERLRNRYTPPSFGKGFKGGKGAKGGKGGKGKGSQMYGAGGSSMPPQMYGQQPMMPMMGGMMMGSGNPMMNNPMMSMRG